MHLDGGAVGLGDGDLVAVARNVGGDVSGGAAADGLDGGGLCLRGARSGDRLLQRFVLGRAVGRVRGARLLGSATIWLRQRPRAPIVRMASRVFLVLAALAAVAALSGRASWVGPAVIVASLSATAAVLIPSKSDEGVATLFGIAFVGIGVAAIGGGAKFLRGGDVLDGIVAIASGLRSSGWGSEDCAGVAHCWH